MYFIFEEDTTNYMDQGCTIILAKSAIAGAKATMATSTPMIIAILIRMVLLYEYLNKYLGALVHKYKKWTKVLLAIEPKWTSYLAMFGTLK